MDIIKGVAEGGEDWQMVLGFMPAGWQEKAKELGALERNRNFDGPEPLLRTLMIHLVDGCSLQETVVRAKLGRIADVSSVALWKRLNCAGEWLRWSALGVKSQWVGQNLLRDCPTGFNLRVVDGSMVSEPGSTGSDWRIHYSINLLSLRCDEVTVTKPKVGESLKNFQVNPGDVLMADRAYAVALGIEHVAGNGGYVLLRMNLTNLPLFTPDGQKISLLRNLRQLGLGEVGDWGVCVKGVKGYISGRVCAIKKSPAAAEKARQEILREARRKGRKVREDTLEAANYTFIFTTLSAQLFDAAKVLEIYRCRWQIELAFKRLKSLLGIGYLPKQDLTGACAWLHGKLLVAFLIEALISAGERFFPWGYPLCQNIRQMQMSVA